jgi:ABC-type lipoprotein release transport system permease subunit
MEKFSPLIRMFLGALLGVILGIIFGLAFGVLIVWITHFAGMTMANPSDQIPYALGSFLGMGAGAMIGSILGAVYSNKR